MIKIKAAYYFLIWLLLIPAITMAGETSGKIKGRIYTYPVTIYGKQYTFILASGSVYSLIDPRVTSELQGSVTEHAKNKVSGSADNQPTSITVPQISIADNAVNNIQFQVVDLSSFAQYFGFTVDGILGVDVYRQFIWDMDNKNKTQGMQSVSEPPPENNYQQCIYYQMDVLPIITNITKNGRIIPFMLSTGLGYSVIDSSMIKSLHLNKTNYETPGIKIDNTEPQMTQSKTNAYYMEDFYFENFHIMQYLFFADTVNFPGGVLGVDFFSRFDQFRLNPVNNSLCFNHFDNSSKEVLRQISVRSYAGNIELYRNAENYLKKSGLENGDIIISINNKNYPTEEITEVRNVLTYSKTLDLQIKRHGNISHIMIN